MAAQPVDSRPALVIGGAICDFPRPMAAISAAELVGSPALYPQALDSSREALFLVRLTQDQYRDASFLDDRILEGAEAIGWVPFAPIEQVAAHVPARPLHFIFHAGHVGSTLLSRLLDEVPGVLGLREPLPLRSLAALRDQPGFAGLSFARALATLLPLWSRGFEDTNTAIVKATSIAGRLAPDLLAASPRSRAVYMNLPPEPYIATLMAGESTRADLEGLTHERLSRLKRLLGLAVDGGGTLSLGEGAAVAWLAERLAQQAAQAALGERLLTIDFEAMLADLPGTLARVLGHFRLPEHLAPQLAQSPTLKRYAKLSEHHEYSPELRRQLLDQARTRHQEEIARGLKLLDRLRAAHPAVAAVY